MSELIPTEGPVSEIDVLRQSHASLSTVSEQFLDFMNRHPEHARPAAFPQDPLLQQVGGSRFPLQPWPLFVGGETLDRLKTASLKIPALLKAVPERFFNNDPRKMAHFFGLENELLAGLLRSDHSGIDGSLCRSDFILNAEGLFCIEANFGGMLGGWETKLRETMYLNSPVMTSFRSEVAFETVCLDPLQKAMEHMLRDSHALNPGSDINLGILVPNPIPAVNPVAVYVDGIYQRVLKNFGGGVTGQVHWFAAGELVKKACGIYCRGKRIHGILEYANGVVPKIVIGAMVAGTVTFYSTPLTFYLTDKRNFALLSQARDSDLLSPEERALVRDHIPWTRLLRDEETTYAGVTLPLRELLRQRADELIIKKGLSSGGKDVLVGKWASREQWDAGVEAALGQGDWIVQAYVPSSPFLFYDRTASRCAPHEVIWGTFGFGNTYGGGFLRMAPCENRRHVINAVKGATEGMYFEVEK